MPNYIPVLETERLILRGFDERDVDTFAEMNADPRFTRFIGDGRPLNRTESWRLMATLIGHWQLRGFGIWAVELKATGELIGRTGLFYPEGWPGIELAWAFHPDAWGQGYATESALAARDWAFKIAGLGHLVSIIQPNNERSKRVAQRIGERYSHRDIINGIPVVIFSVNQHELEREPLTLTHAVAKSA
ncbi:GNAT family N-acetyltransferase [Gynuella sunshinyii]|uniref:Acetyltransferase, including N-acetylase of ribosomal protein n=1 Tax=Gynuella sunshinyii YC6258 TaxID=1445510 RepID=A0A0C5VPM6_9GAMM|nr:GNAT family N-acetyltransferase [Gynuella sunshinyii]AJQ96597.1 acetyltransferase, including N-acetylase of ribosomal protein [Gynuella sunshinyii YC6258]